MNHNLQTTRVRPSAAPCSLVSGFRGSVQESTALAPISALRTALGDIFAKNSSITPAEKEAG